jgi:hypothetical protein
VASFLERHDDQVCQIIVLPQENVNERNLKVLPSIRKRTSISLRNRYDWSPPS